MVKIRDGNKRAQDLVELRPYLFRLEYRVQADAVDVFTDLRKV